MNATLRRVCGNPEPTNSPTGKVVPGVHHLAEHLAAFCCRFVHRLANRGENGIRLMSEASNLCDQLLQNLKLYQCMCPSIVKTCLQVRCQWIAVAVV